MYIWIFIVLIAQFMNAIVVLLDKYVIRQVSQPVVYAFAVGILSVIPIVLVPFGVVDAPSAIIVLNALAAGCAFIVSVVLLYRALAISDTSDVAPVMGGAAALSTLVFSLLVLRDTLPESFFLGFTLLVIGTFLVSHYRLSYRSLTYAVVAGILFGLSSVLIKNMFIVTTFLDAFFWSRMGNVFAALLLLIPGESRHAIMHDVTHQKPQLALLIIGNKALTGTAVFLTLVAINLGNVSLVSALAGLQFVFLLLFAVAAGKRFPQYFPHETHQHALIPKILAVFFILAGFFTLFI